MKIYQVINDYIESNGIKQKYISNKAGIPEGAFSMMLSGKRKMTVDEFIEIIIALGVDANYFVNKVNQKETS